MVDGYGYYGYSMEGFREVIMQWSQYGIFDILLPLILVFAVVFAILEKINIFNNRGVSLIIALSIGLFTISNAYISGFFMYLFSNLALGIAIMLVLVVLLGISLKPDEKTWKWIFGILGGVIFLVVLARAGTFQVLFGQGFYFWLQQNAAWAVIAILVAFAFIAVLSATNEEKKKKGLLVRGD